MNDDDENDETDVDKNIAVEVAMGHAEHGGQYAHRHNQDHGEGQ